MTTDERSTNEEPTQATDTVLMDTALMDAALDLARAERFTRPNPKVGAVVVRDGQIVGRGAHARAGGPHAEAIALDAMAREGIEARGATMYVTLEPCSHEGRTAPCAPLLIAAGLARVVVAMEDPDARVSGEGIRQLEDAGIEVAVGVREVEARRSNAPYIKHRTTGRPYVSLKLAQSIDGRLAAPDGSARWITGEETRREVHLRRAEAGAVLVGSGTVAADDPELTARNVDAPEQPLRIVADSSGRTPADRRVFDDGASTIVVTTAETAPEVRSAWKEAGAEVLEVGAGRSGIDLEAMLDLIGARGVTEILCEGGARLATSLLEADLVDRLEVHVGPLVLGAGGPGIGDVGVASMSSARRFVPVSTTASGSDSILVFEREDV